MVPQGLGAEASDRRLGHLIEATHAGKVIVRCRWVPPGAAAPARHRRAGAGPRSRNPRHAHVRIEATGLGEVALGVGTAAEGTVRARAQGVVAGGGIEPDRHVDVGERGLEGLRAEVARAR